MISTLHALILGFVEGLTEFLPVSSTGHLILTSHWLGLGYGRGIKAFEVVIQSGALLAVIGLYLPRVRAMLRGLAGKDPAGLRLLGYLMVAFLPAAVVGLLSEDWVKAKLFGPGPVVAALAVGGVLMIVAELPAVRRLYTRGTGRTLAEMTWRAALLIGCAQCLALWPGTSRSMVTILAALLLGFAPVDAAMFSFLLALPTLGAATALDLFKDGREILSVAQAGGLAIGFLASFVVAWVAVKGFVAWLTRHGLAPFGWYRIAAAIVFGMVLLSQLTLTGTIERVGSPSNPGTAAGATVVRVGDRSYPIVPNPVGQELGELTGHRVRLSGTIIKEDGNPGEAIKVLNYQDLDKKKKH